MQASEKEFLQTVGRFVVQRIKAHDAPLQERIEKLEAAFLQSQEQLAQVSALLEARLTAHREKEFEDFVAHCQWRIGEAIKDIPAGPPGKDGAAGIDGKDGAPGKDIDVQAVMDHATNVVENLCATWAPIPGKDGKDGVDGADGKSVSADDVQRMVVDAVAVAVAGLPVAPSVVGGHIDRAGDLYFSRSDGSIFKVGHVVGADADPAKIAETVKKALADAVEKIPLPKDGKDGKDGFSLTDFYVRQDGVRALTIGFGSGENKKEFPVKLACPLYRGVWREECGPYEIGDVVTHEGSTWIALDETKAKPGTAESLWQLAVKRGRDGREGKEGKQGQSGKDGRDGRDLTQMGPDGRKW
jgi:hypothetical protein